MIPAWDGVQSDDHVCSVCGEDQGYPLWYCTVLIQPGEEGYSEVTMCLCDYHSCEMSANLVALGFVSHNHHGTSSLGGDCGNAGSECTQEAEYGPELVQPLGLPSRQSCSSRKTFGTADATVELVCTGTADHAGLHGCDGLLWRD